MATAGAKPSPGREARGTTRRGAPLGTAALAVGMALCAHASAQGALRLVSRASTGERGNGTLLTPSVTADGQRIAFAGHHDCTNLVPGDTNAAGDIFVHDRTSGTTKRISVSSAGAQGNGHSISPSISADGRWVLFGSSADNLVPGGSGMPHVYVHDLATGSTSILSVSSTGVQGDGESFPGSISPDGRYVSFDSFATNLVPGDTNWAEDVFVADRVTGTLERVSLSSSGQPANFDCDWSSVSADGRYVAFNSYATNLVTGDNNGTWDVFVRDRQLATTTLVNVNQAGSVPAAGAYRISISDDGRFAAFASSAPDLVSGDTNNSGDVFLRDLLLGTTSLVSVHGPNPPPGLGSGWPSLSPNGRFAIFFSDAHDLVAGDNNGLRDVFVRDLVTQTTVMVSRNASGAPGNGPSAGTQSASALSPDGRFAVFESRAQNLTGGPPTASGVFLFDRQGCTPGLATYCVSSSTSHGCVPTISGAGVPSALAGAGFVITVNTVEGAVPGLIFYGVNAPAALPWNAGTLCVGPPLRRTTAQASGGTPGQCDGALAVDWNAYVAAHPLALGHPFSEGATVWAQGWFRDPSVPGGSNLSNGLWFDLCR
jgi:Tol biopolymer transport system component